jgi:alpha-tubulin suppressor-like RCC1 family protein
MLSTRKNKRRAVPVVLAAAAAAAAVIAGAPAPSAEAISPSVFTFPVITQAPTQVAGLPAGVQQVATGVSGNYGLALLANGTVSGWGINASANGFGVLGDGTTVNHTSPAPVHNLSGITQIAGGGEHALAIGSGGQVWAWGRNADGELGDGTLVNRPTPQPVPGVTGITQIAAGNGFSLALRSDGTVWAWGDDRFGELGDGTFAAHRARFQHVPGLTGIIQIAAGGSSSFAVRSDGTLFSWGGNGSGQLGDGTTAARSTPAPVAGLTGVTQVSSGLNHTLAIAGAKHAIWGWGDNSGAQLGDGTRINRLSPVPLGLLSVSGIVSLDAGVFESAGIRSDGRLLTWGDQVITPTVVSSLIGVTRVSLGDAIDLVVGQPAFVAVPDLHGDSVDQAATALQNAGLVLGSQGSAVDDSCDFINEVTDQNPHAGTTVAAGSAVSITIGTRPKHPCP